ncbi:hypothetical protein CONCODRAFT_72468 [Conidiobolus coronatus NRRL 28638]|uniref:Fe2OG dioxygenase domain-containing protein n=1 Tax=Conidiobolus coronatus (strain ATCC 28846 / CBS 209.66 / NRRL 28638) TaxID=796925 RepID=A0A137NZU7_CONC2|nr:hypothetical protein CONCODRAFT_72468 [Conidiobolus coronatus NRRL 28638]|eukprot:KXN68134.1 hypothetical protein CONCODRAFT_72468 [Conidiobolus coronatus NRRL 28638]
MVEVNEFDYLPGATVIYDFISEAEELELVSNIDKSNWGGNGQYPNPELRRRTQHFGYLFSYRYRQIEKYLGDFPQFLKTINKKLVNIENGHIDLNSIIINEYEVGQGIMPHTDSAEIFGPVISSLSLLSPCNMEFTPTKQKTLELQKSDQKIPKINIHLPRRSLLIMKENCRYDYQHSISKNSIEYLPIINDGSLSSEEFTRDRRISLTFRTMLDTESFDNSNNN